MPFEDLSEAPLSSGATPPTEVTKTEEAAGRAAITLHRWIDVQLSPTAAMMIALAVVMVIAVGDFRTGPYLVFATFYLAPVALAAWFAGRGAGLAVAATAGIAGVIVTAINPREVVPAVYLWNGTFRFITYSVVVLLVTAERAAMETIRSLASTDQLTGLLNRHRFYELAERELVLARRNQRPIAMVYIDVDDLKLRNDTYGHEAGDAMLVEFADATRAETRASDLVARLGGDEFALLLPETDAAEAEKVVERLRERLLASDVLPIKFSAGIAAGIPAPVPAGTNDTSEDVEAFVRRADLLMLEAKQQGKGLTMTGSLLGSS